MCQVIKAINQAISVKDIYNIRVMNLSLGRPVMESYTQDPLCQAVEAAWQAGIVVVVAAGNDGRDNSAGTDGYGTISAPGNDPYVITVGAMNTKNTPDRGDDVITSYSSKGPTAIDHIAKPDLVAPGNRVISLQMGGNLSIVIRKIGPPRLIIKQAVKRTLQISTSY
jgi:serine protease AprX